MTTRCAPQVGAPGSRVDRTCVETRRIYTDVRSEPPHGRRRRERLLEESLDAPATARSTAASGSATPLSRGRLRGRRDADRRCSRTPTARSRRWLALAVRRRLRRRGAVEVWGDAGYARADADRVRPDAAAAADAARAAARRRRPSCSHAPARRCAAAWRSRAARSLVVDAWFALGPALVLLAFGAQEPALEHWPVYVLALAAQLLADGVVDARARAGSARACRRGRVLHDLRMVYRVDAAAGPDRAARRARRRRRARSRAAGAAARLPAAVLLARARGRACASRSSSAAPTAARRCCCATCSRRTTSTPAATRRTSSGLTVAVAERMGLDEDTAPLRRARRAAARHRQDRRARRDHQQARAR